MQGVTGNGFVPNFFGPGLGGFQDGDADTGVLGTLLQSVLFNDILGNLLAIMSAAGIAPTAGRYADLADSISVLSAQRKIRLVNLDNVALTEADNGKIIYYDTSGGALTTVLPDVTAMAAGFNVELRCEGPYPLTVNAVGVTTQIEGVGSVILRAKRQLLLFGDTQVFRSVVRRSALYAPGRAYITATGNFTVPAGVTELDVELWGGGGGGNPTLQTGGGGAPGGYAFKRCTVQPGQVLACTIGAGGAASSPGGTTSFDTIFSATGGGKGNNGALSDAPGVGVGGDFNTSGPYGGLYLGTGGSGSVPAAGAGSPFGAPSPPAGSAGTVPGAGGGGGGIAQTGGNGLIIVRW